MADIDFLTQEWGEEVVSELKWWAEVERAEMPFTEFLTHCTACGGNWGGMLLTGIHELLPHIYDTIPEHMGKNAWACLCETLALCGVITDA